MTQVTVLYHRSCIDGSAARFAAWRKFGDEAKYIAVQYKEPLPKIEDDSEVYILDFSYSREILTALHQRVKKLVVLDHHIDAMKELEGLEFATFDMNQSGATLAWRYFFPDEPIPQLFKHVEDRDLWRFKLPETKDIVNGFRAYQDNLTAWQDAVDKETGPYFLKRYQEQGPVILNYQQSIINEAVRNTSVLKLWGHRVGVVNASTLISEIGHAICHDEKLKVDFSMSYFILNQSREVVFSLRSKDIPVNKFAKMYGGAGHERSCGFRTDMSTLSRILLGFA